MELAVEVLIVGGGATGTAIARDLALRGLSVCLLERGDLASGASGSDQGLLHSGARYVTDDGEAARECVEEGAILRRIAPHCIEETGGLFLVLDARAELLFQPAFVAGCAAAGIPLEELNHQETLRTEPLVAPNVIRSFRVPDGVLDAWRLCVANVLAAQDHGAWAFRGVTVARLLREGDRIVGAAGRNSITMQDYTVRAEQTINAAGAWAGRLAALAGVEVALTPTKGTLLAMARRPVTHVLHNCRPPAAGDTIVPDGARVVLGAMSHPSADPDDATVSEGDQERLLEEGIRMVPVLREVATAGARTVVHPFAPSDPARRGPGRDFLLLDHEERDGLGGLVTVAGGELTTARRRAEVAGDLIAGKLGVTAPCRTADEPLPGAAGGRRNVLRSGG